jgi:ankyrin repeat protein
MIIELIIISWKPMNLHNCCHDRDLVGLRSCLNQGRNINKRDATGWTPLYITAVNGYSEVTRELLKNGADPNLQIDTQSGSTALHTAICFGYLAIVKELLRYGANPNLQHHSGRTALHVASAGGDLRFVRELLKYDVDPYLVDDLDRTAFDCATTDKIRELLKNHIYCGDLKEPDTL